MIVLAPWLAIAAQALTPLPQETSHQEAVSDSEIVVTGTRDKKHPKEDVAEEPWESTERIFLGSRIARIPSGRRVFNSVASETGLAGLVANGSSGFDATGGSNPAARKRLVKSCRVADEEGIGEKTACALVKIEEHIREGEYDAATAALSSLGGLNQLSSAERYYAGHYAYRIADEQEDDAGREIALRMMFNSGAMPESEQRSALKSLVALAVRRKDDSATITSLEQLIAIDPASAINRANLAVVYARLGQHDKALPEMRTAVSIVEQKGVAAPKSWSEYVAARDTRQHP